MPYDYHTFTVLRNSIVGCINFMYFHKIPSIAEIIRDLFDYSPLAKAKKPLYILGNKKLWLLFLNYGEEKPVQLVTLIRNVSSQIRYAESLAGETSDNYI